MKKMKKMKKLKRLLGATVFLLMQIPLWGQQVNTFEIGMLNLDRFTKDANGNIDPAAKKNVLNVSYNSSVLNVVAADGFNTVVTYSPDVLTSTANWKNFIMLVKNNGMKIMDNSNYYFKPSGPQSHSGINKYDEPNCPYTPAVNLNARYSQIYNDPLLSSAIYGHILGNELSSFHSFAKEGVCPSTWCDGMDPGQDYNCINSPDYYTAEQPPQNLSDAIGIFKYTRNYNNTLANKLNDQKIIFGVAVHGHTLEEFSDGGSFEERDYINMTTPQLADAVTEASFFSFDFFRWTQTPSNTLNYLGKFRSIDYIKRKYNSVLAQINIDLDAKDSILPYARSSNQSIKNFNHLWFQTYTSIIHGVDGVQFEGFVGSQDLTLAADIENENYRNTANVDRFEFNRAPAAYRNYIRYLGMELAYLVKQNLISTDPASIVYSKKTDADANCILPASSTYLPATLTTADGRDIQSLFTALNWGTAPLTNLHRTEENGLRYTIRTNGTDVIMIISNPNPFPISAVSLNFNNISNNVIRNSTGVKVLFENANPTYATVMGTSYKTSRNSGIDLTNLAVNPTSYLMNYPSPSNKQVSMSFGPFDVHVLKFVTGTIPNYNNGWDLAWTNNGSGNIASWSPVSTDKFIPGDFDGNGTQELLAVQTNSNNANAWATLLKYQNDTWNWAWSNFGNNCMNNLVQGWGIRAADKFHVGNFDGITGDELLCVQGDGNYMSLLKFQSGNWTTLWSNWGIYNMDFVAHKNNIVVGDFDGNGKADVLGVSGNLLTIFNYTNNNFVAGWTSSSSQTHILYPYRGNLRAGNFNGDGKTDVFGVNGSWSTVFYYNPSVNGNWQFGESTYGGSSFGWWSNPPLATDNCLIGNVDTDPKDEFFWIQGATNGAYATTVSTNTTGSFSGGWTNNGNPAYIDDWAVSETGSSNTKYFLIKPTTASKKYLLAMRLYGCNKYLVNMYQTNTTNDYRIIAADESNPSVDNKVSVYPNPAADEFKIGYSLSKEGGEVKVGIYNMFGQLVKETIVSGAQGVNEHAIDVSNLAKGMYVIRIEKEGAFFTEKISIQR
jgi:hypothetical protein